MGWVAFIRLVFYLCQDHTALDTRQAVSDNSHHYPFRQRVTMDLHVWKKEAMDDWGHNR